MHGKGVYIFKNDFDKEKYEGEFKKDKIIGKGVLFFKDGKQYDGEFYFGAI